MAVKYAYFKQMLNYYFEKGGHGLSEEFVKKFVKLIHMAGYLDEVDPEAHKIVEEYNMLCDLGAMTI